ncbi:MAG: desulfoferrodoxin family protein [Eubacteriales bacterium]|nr:desulfoferrodoxin family protein [Eubacteriales bacterium]
MELKVFKCMHCGNIIEMVEDHGVPVYCCGEPMKEFKAGETDGAQEKHVPVVEVDGDTVRANVGEVTHPMSEEHHISFIWLVTDKGIYRRALPHTGAPEASFRVAADETPEAVYEFCNLHGLWRTKI